MCVGSRGGFIDTKVRTKSVLVAWGQSSHKGPTGMGFHVYVNKETTSRKGYFLKSNETTSYMFLVLLVFLYEV
jgi:hypothetical protein